MDLNKVQLIGRTTSDIELKQTPNGASVSQVSIATNRYWNDGNGNRQEQTEFHNIVFWGKLAEIASQYAKKGKKMYIEGRLQTRSWEGQDGVKRYKTEIVAENMILLDGTGGGQDMDMQKSNASNAYSNPTPAITKSQPKQEDEISIEDLPF